MRRNSTFIVIIIIVFITIFFRFRNLNQPSQYLFDEDLYIYTANLLLQGDRRAFEWWQPPDTSSDSPYQYRPPAVEWLHPPLSKYAIAKSIAIFGDQPWAWRLPSAVAGVGLVLAIGWLAKALFDRKSITLLAMSIASIESFLVIQSRLASADIFVAFFTTAALASFVQWQVKKWRWGLPLAGILAGLAMASKWSGGLIVLALVALLIIDFFRMQRYQSTKQSGYNKRHAELVSASRNSTSTRHAGLDPASSTEIKQLIIALSTLIILPLLIYVLAYLPALAIGHSPAHILELHHQAWQYHATNRAVHPNSSPAYMWLLNQKPVWYYLNEESGVSIKAQASPIIFWGSMMAMLLSILAIFYSSRSSTKQLKQLSVVSTILSISTKENQALLSLLITFLALWLPWLFVQRPTFYYHFLPCVPILIIFLNFWLDKVCIGFSTKNLSKSN